MRNCIDNLQACVTALGVIRKDCDESGNDRQPDESACRNREDERRRAAKDGYVLGQCHRRTPDFKTTLPSLFPCLGWEVRTYMPRTLRDRVDKKRA
jgi:hypothetical protein